MRVIKFRGKVDGVWWHVSPDDFIKWKHFWTEVDRKTVGQFVGLSDKQDVFEGDIVSLPNTDICQIEYKDTMFVATSITKKFWGCDKYIYWQDDATTVIGNAHDNPTLLVQKQEEKTA